ncbi:MAG: putative molybdenum carrier protein [Pseudomonadota bacterium]
MTITKIISGGQTGADQGALDAAIAMGIDHSGWIPKGRLTESGPLPEKYLLKEMPSKSYPKRTEKNILDSDGTVIISRGRLAGGSALTKKLALQHGKPVLHINLKKISPKEATGSIFAWTEMHRVAVLNVAGPRASKDPLIYEDVKAIVGGLLKEPR